MAEKYEAKKVSSKVWQVIEVATGKQMGKFESGLKSSAESRAKAMAERLNAQPVEK